MGFLSLTIAILVLLPGILTVRGRTKETSNYLFLGLCVSLSVWVMANYLADAVSNMDLFFTRLTFLAIVFGTIFFWDFTYYFPLRTPHTFPRLGSYISAVVVAMITMTPWFIPEVSYINDIATVEPGILYPLFLVYFCFFIVLAVRRLYISMRNSTGIYRQRAKYVLLAIGLMTVWGAITNLFLPLILGSNSLAVFGTYSTLVFTGLIAYAMLKHHLFDIKSAVARAFAYTLTLGVLILLYLLVLFGITELINIDNDVNGVSRLIYVGLALIGAIIFHPTKKFFDRISNKIFYRDSYDPDDLFSELNKVLITNFQLEALVEKSSEIISKYLKTEYVEFYILKSSKQHLYGPLKDISLYRLNELAENMESSLMLADELQDNQEISLEQKELIRSFDAGLVSLLTTTTEKIGVLLLGRKKSGENFTRVDLQTIEIISGELALAFQNSIRFEEISAFNETLRQKIEIATHELRKTNEKLKALDEAKDEFISMASHQLRTPLTSVKGFVSLVLEGDTGDINDQQRSLLNQAFASSQRMVYLISDLLNVSRLKTGKFVIEPSDVYLPNVIEEELSQVKEMASVKNIEIEFNKPDEFPMLKLDDMKIRQVIMNFVDNAIHYTPNDGKITVALEVRDHSIAFTVTDTGIGVPKKEQHRLFTKFYRAGNALKMRPDGTGIGLFMAKKVVTTSGGAIIFKSTEGKGSTFGFSFPLEQPE